MYWKSASVTCWRVCHECGQISSALMVLKNVSATALFQQFPFLLIHCLTGKQSAAKKGKLWSPIDAFAFESRENNIGWIQSVVAFFNISLSSRSRRLSLFKSRLAVGGISSGRNFRLFTCKSACRHNPHSVTFEFFDAAMFHSQSAWWNLFNLKRRN